MGHEHDTVAIGRHLRRAMPKTRLPITHNTTAAAAARVVFRGKCGDQRREAGVAQIEVGLTRGGARHEAAVGEEVDVFAVFTRTDHTLHVSAKRIPGVVIHRQIPQHAGLAGGGVHFVLIQVVTRQRLFPSWFPTAAAGHRGRVACELTAIGEENLRAVAARGPEPAPTTAARPLRGIHLHSHRARRRVVLAHIEIAGVQIRPEDTRPIGGDDMAEVRRAFPGLFRRQRRAERRVWSRRAVGQHID
jgi:hypothetical protein